MKDRYDVVVFGGGPAGITAASQAARAGAEVLLVEKTAMLGGTTTSAGVNFPGLFHAWGRQVIAGIGWELVRECVALKGDALPDFNTAPDRHWKHQVWVDRALYAALADETVVGSGADVLFHSMPAAVEDDGTDKTVSLCTKTGMQRKQARVVIDCTGDANAVGLAGGDLVRHQDKQPGTLICRFSGYDMSSINEEQLAKASNQALESGDLTVREAPNGAQSIRRILVQQGSNAIDIVGVDGGSSEGRTQAELAGRAALLRLYRFFRAQPGLEQLTIDFMASECGIRETVTIKGRETVTLEDYLGGRVFEDAVCYSFYPIDWHRADGKGLDKRYLDEGVVPTVPLGALLPLRLENVIVAGRSIASDQSANSALRVQATCMATGQAAGALAALAVQENREASAVSVEAVRDLLARNGAIVPFRS